MAELLPRLHVSEQISQEERQSAVHSQPSYRKLLGLYNHAEEAVDPPFSASLLFPTIQTILSRKERDFEDLQGLGSS